MPSPTPVHERAARIRYRRALSLLAMTLVWPGSAQLLAGNRRVGLIATRIWVGLLTCAVVLLGVVALDRTAVFWMASSPAFLGALWIALIVLAVGWALLILDAWRLGQPLSLTLSHRRAVVGFNGMVCFSIAATLLFAAHLVHVQRDFVIATFASGEASDASEGRYNVLLMGGDSGAGRWGMRPDALTVASINAETGKTVLVALPRNMAKFPFAEGSVMAEQFPKGFRCEEDCYLNSVSTWAQDHTELFDPSLNPDQIGAEATISAVEGITGLDISYYAMVNLAGFKGLVDAVGGVELNVRQPIPVGGLGSDVTHYIEPGVKTLNGHDTLWFARAREGSDDYSRMARQKCVMNAMLGQVSPSKVVRNFEKIAKASSAMVATDLPASELDRFIELALKAKGQKMATLSLVPPLINTGDPDIALVQEKVQSTIDRAEGRVEPRPKKTTSESTGDGGSDSANEESAPAAPTGVTGGSLGSLSEGYTANDTEDLGAAC